MAHLETVARSRRYGLAPYQHGPRLERQRTRRQVARPLVWALILTVVPFVWLATVASFARVVF